MVKRGEIPGSGLRTFETKALGSHESELDLWPDRREMEEVKRNLGEQTDNPAKGLDAGYMYAFNVMLQRQLVSLSSVPR